MIRANSADKGEAKEAQRTFEELTGVAWDQGGPGDPSPYYTPTILSPERIAEEWAGGEPYMDPDADSEFDQAYSLAQEGWGGGGEGDTKWSQYVTGDPSDQYTEHLVTLPVRPNTTDQYGVVPNNYGSPHWEEPNVLAHMRYDYDPDALRLEEIQSDWLQEMREAGGPRNLNVTGEMIDRANRSMNQAEGALLAVRDRLPRRRNRHDVDWDRVSPEDNERYTQLSGEYNAAVDARNLLTKKYQAPPRAPLANVNDWTAMMLRRAMLQAAESDKPKLRWTSGASQDRRYSPEPGRAKYYDELIPNIANKIARPYGDSRAMPEHWNGGELEDIRQADMWSLDLPPDLMKYLQKSGKVPFFKHGGKVGG